MILNKGKFKGQEFSKTPTWYQEWLKQQPFFDSMFQAPARTSSPSRNALRGWDGYSKRGQAAYDAQFQREMDEADEYDPDPATRDKRDAEDIVIAECAARGVTIKRRDLIDWNITGEEDNATLRQFATDICNEEHTAKAEAKNAWRYQH